MQPFDETRLSEARREQFELMSEREKDLVRKGHPVKIISAKTEEEICSFNENNFEIPKEALKSLARVFLPDIIKYYEDKKTED